VQGQPLKGTTSPIPIEPLLLLLILCKRPQVKFIVKIGDLVLVKEDNLPLLVWKKAMTIDIYSGRDGIVRVVSIRTATGTFKRPIAKICVL